MDYQILNGDHVCGEFRNGELIITDRVRAPLFLQDFYSWVASRAISSSRGITSRNIRNASGLSPVSDAVETSLRVHAACITDNYWVREFGNDLTYDKVCFDDYDGFFRDLALGLDFSWSKYISDSLNPELTNIGNSDKAWHIDSKKVRWLYKRQPLNECFFEVLASRLAGRIGINTVDYEICYASDPDPEIGRFGIVRSRDFTQGRNINLEPAHLMLRYHNIRAADIEANADIFDSFGLVREYLDIIYLDIITGNPDRHDFNYGLLRDSNTGKITGMAPNYDNNFAFFADEMPTEGFIRAAAKYSWTKPVITEDILEEISDQMRNVPGYDENIHVLRSVLRRNRF